MTARILPQWRSTRRVVGIGSLGDMLATFVCAMALMTATLYALRGGLVTPSGINIVGVDAQGVGFGAMSVLIAGWYFGPLYGLALILTVIIHEYGHVAAFRITGHEDARFRLVPLFGGYAISDRAPSTEGEEFFVSIAGPALSLAPMVLAFVLCEIVDPWSRPLANFLWIFAATTAALNFLNLLPFWPLDGGRCLRAVVHAFEPRAALWASLGMSAAFAAAAVAVGSVLLLLVALLGVATVRPMARELPGMTKGEAALALGAYVFTAAAHFAGGALILSVYL